MRKALDIVAVSNGSRPPVSLRRRVSRQQDNNEETLHVQVQLLRAARRAPGTDRAAHRPGDVHRSLCRDSQGGDARYRHQPPAVLGQHAHVGDRPPAVRLRRDLLAVHRRTGAQRWQRQTGAGSQRRGRAVRRRGRAEPDPAGPGPRHAAGRLRLHSAGRRLQGAQYHRPAHPLPLDPQALPEGRRRTAAGSLRHQRAGHPAAGDAGHRRPLEHHPLRRHERHAPRHARQHRQLRAGRRDPLRRDPRDGARPVRAGRQGGVPPEPGLGRGGGRRLHVAAPSARRPAIRAARGASATCCTRMSTGTCA